MWWLKHGLAFSKRRLQGFVELHPNVLAQSMDPEQQALSLIGFVRSLANTPALTTRPD
jgi:hypothetical protein